MNPFTLAAKTERRYRQYLETTFYFRAPVLRKSFREALSSGHLAKGLYVESTPVFKRGEYSSRLFGELLSTKPDSGFLLSTDRHLYRHQESAIKKVFGQNRNVVVATGTASGKTEAFLYPVLLQLYEEFVQGTLSAGVRALILYPMNALANDQRERLGAICKRLESNGSGFRFTFGQYIGETPEDERDHRRHAEERLAQRLPGELILRQEIRESPPHILLTNYSMLEYLLIRPADSPLFDHGMAAHWRFLVLDEAHQYRGSKGMEMAMLLRRLKQRLREGGCENPFRCIATSATLGGGSHDAPAVGQFAANLFGEPFEPADVVLGEIEPVTVATGQRRFEVRHYHRLLAFLDEQEGPPDELLEELELKLKVANLPPRGVAGELLKLDERSTRLRQLVCERPQNFIELAAELFPDRDIEEAQRALSVLTQLLLRSRDVVTDQPLLAARYHFFLRSLEGAFVSYWPEPKVSLERLSQTEQGVFFETALCRECGQHYLVGREFEGRLKEAIRDPGDPHFGATFFRPLEEMKIMSGETEKPQAGRELLRLCVRCGALSRQGGSCKHSETIAVEKQPEAAEREDRIPRCSSCEYRGQDPVREVVHGTDGPHVVIATTLFREMPVERRKILAFADSRQEAAFFAWYLENSYKDILARNLILLGLRKLQDYSLEGLSFRELAPELRDVYREKKVFPPAAGDLEIIREAWLRLYREFLTEEQRISLEGVGLVNFQMKLAENIRLPDQLKTGPWSLSDVEARNLVVTLLDFMRHDKAVDLRTGPGVAGLTWLDLGLQGRATGVTLGRPGGRSSIKSWEGRAGRRGQYVAKLLQRRTRISWQTAQENAEELLREIWQCLKEADEKTPMSADRMLISDRDSRILNPDWWRIRLIGEEDHIFKCDTCARLYSISVAGVCPRLGCPGTLGATTLKQLEANHYRNLYREDLGGLLRVEEHTAQLDHDKAREFQRAFKRGEIHVLSSSTTFEVGVDLGDLDLIFLRNVPPEAFNYAQRVGRAGRRHEHPGFAVTFCRQRPHDLYYFKDPEHIISGVVRPPVLALTNKKIIQRHITATALSAFFKEAPNRFQNVEAFFEDLENPTGSISVRRFLEENQESLWSSLKAIVPPESHSQVGLRDGDWILEIAGDNSRFALAEDELASDYAAVAELERRSAADGDYTKARWAKARRRTIAGEDVLSFLSRKAIIPKYGFPVDVVELDLQRTSQSPISSEVSLQRDLSIATSEFAPTSRLVANKFEWHSYGIKKVLERE